MITRRALLLGLMAGACLSAAAQSLRPNILFAVADDWSYPHAGAYGCKWVKTPAFERVAREGVLFANARPPNAKCSPSRACIITGRNSWQLKAAANQVPFFPPEFKSYSEALGEHGYFVGMTQKGWAPGIATNSAGKPRELTGHPFNRRTATPPTPYISNNDYAANFADFLDAAPRNQPWCFWALCFGKRPAEEPYNLKHDSECLRNLAAKPEQQARKDQLLRQLFVELKEQGDLRMFGNGGVFEAEPYAGPHTIFSSAS